LTDNLVSYWALDEASGVRYDSVVASANDLTDNNMVGSTAGMHNLAAQFVEADSDSLTRADNASLSLGANTAVTVSAWVRADSGTTNGAIVAKWGGGGNLYDIEYRLYIKAGAGGGTDKFSFGVGDGTAGLGLAEWPLGDLALPSAWFFVVGWYDPSTSKVYIQVDNGTPVEAAWAGGTHNGNGVLALGRAGSFGSYYGDFTSDAVGLWFRVLTAQERTDLYNAGAGLFY